MLEHFRINRIEHFVRTESTKEKKQGRSMVPLILHKNTASCLPSLCSSQWGNFTWASEVFEIPFA